MLAASILLAFLPTASALSSAQYPAISCSSWPATPSNDREWNSVRTSSGRCSRYSSIARCSALSATSPLSAPLQGHISVICSDVPKQLLYHHLSGLPIHSVLPSDTLLFSCLNALALLVLLLLLTLLTLLLLLCLLICASACEHSPP